MQDKSKCVAQSVGVCNPRLECAAALGLSGCTHQSSVSKHLLPCYVIASHWQCRPARVWATHVLARQTLAPFCSCRGGQLEIRAKQRGASQKQVVRRNGGGGSRQNAQPPCFVTICPGLWLSSSCLARNSWRPPVHEWKAAKLWRAKTPCSTFALLVSPSILYILLSGRGTHADEQPLMILATRRVLGGTFMQVLVRSVKAVGLAGNLYTTSTGLAPATRWRSEVANVVLIRTLLGLCWDFAGTAVLLACNLRIKAAWKSSRTRLCMANCRQPPVSSAAVFWKVAGPANGSPDGKKVAAVPGPKVAHYRGPT